VKLCRKSINLFSGPPLPFTLLKSFIYLLWRRNRNTISEMMAALERGKENLTVG